MKVSPGYSLAFSVVIVGITAALLTVPSRQSSARAQTPANPPASAADKSEVERGRYLVEDVAMCGECHTPRDEHGQLRTDAWLKGASIWIQPVVPVQNWALNVPALAGWPSFTEEQGERILEKGTGPQGEELRPPMHIYHMNHADAKAIIAYLRSLPH
jgi:cytochrome c